MKITMTKTELKKRLHEAWRNGVRRSISRLEREAQKTENADVHYSSAIQDAAEMLEGLLRRGR